MLLHRVLRRSLPGSLAIRNRLFSIFPQPCLSEVTPERLDLKDPPTSAIPVVIDTCPSLSCSCLPMPEDLDIDYTAPLAGTVPSYSRHLVFATGKRDWTSRIEDENRGANIAKILKDLVGPRGRLYNPQRNLLITNSSFDPASKLDSAYPIQTAHKIAVYLFPDFRLIHNVDYNNNTHLAHLSGALPLNTFTNNESSNPFDKLPETYDERFSRIKIAATSQIRKPVVLICGHGSRDKRCGILGPILQTEFIKSLRQFENELSHSDPSFIEHYQHPEVGLISHMGGHRWAGNVIIYIPPTFETLEGPSPLAGKGIWYGRVKPQHVEGIVRETIMGGRIIKDLFRGGIHKNSTPLTI